jgi:hypothetical protein
VRVEHDYPTVGIDRQMILARRHDPRRREPAELLARDTGHRSGIDVCAPHLRTVGRLESPHA